MFRSDRRHNLVARENFMSLIVLTLVGSVMATVSVAPFLTTGMM
jgi:hypothetical protein